MTHITLSSPWRRILAFGAVLAIGALWAAKSGDTLRVSAATAVPTATPSSICMRGMLGPDARKPTFSEQLAACNAWAESDHGLGSTLYRSQLLFERGTTRYQLAQAFTDLTTLIENERHLFMAYAQRSLLQEQVFGDVDAALRDTTSAINIALSQQIDGPNKLAHLYVNRSRLRAQSAQVSEAISVAQDVLADMNAALSLDPDNQSLQIARHKAAQFAEDMKQFATVR